MTTESVLLALTEDERDKWRKWAKALVTEVGSLDSLDSRTTGDMDDLRREVIANRVRANRSRAELQTYQLIRDARTAIHDREGLRQELADTIASRDEAERDHDALLKRNRALEAELKAALAERDRLQKLFDDAGEGAYNVLALIEYYQNEAIDADERVTRLHRFAIGLGPALEACGKIMTRSGGAARDEWRGKGAIHHVAKAIAHLARWQMGQREDPDTGESALAHAATRLLMAWTCERENTAE